MFCEIQFKTSAMTEYRTKRVDSWPLALRAMAAIMRHMIPAERLAVDPTTRSLVEFYEAGKGEPPGGWQVFACGDFSVAVWEKNDDGSHLSEEQRRAKVRSHNPKLM